MSEEVDKKYSMFYPKTKSSLLMDYPELAKIETFKKLGKEDMLFVWYMGCKSSPFYNEENPRVKREKCMTEAYTHQALERNKEKFLAGDFPEKIRIAIHEMTRFEVGPRMRAKKMIETIMGNYEGLIDIDIKKEFITEKGEVDWTKKKAYIDACSTVSKVLPNLINQAEGGFSLSETEDGKEIDLSSEDLVDKFHHNE